MNCGTGATSATNGIGRTGGRILNWAQATSLRQRGVSRDEGKVSEKKNVRNLIFLL